MLNMIKKLININFTELLKKDIIQKKQMKLGGRYDSTLTKPNLLYDKKVIDAVKVRPYFAHSKFSCASQKRSRASQK